MVSACLTHALIPRTNWPGFRALVKKMLVDGFFSSEASWYHIGQGGGAGAIDISSESGSHAGGKGSIPTLSGGICLGEFSLENPEHTFDQVTVIDGQKMYPNVVLSHLGMVYI